MARRKYLHLHMFLAEGLYCAVASLEDMSKSMFDNSVDKSLGFRENGRR